MSVCKRLHLPRWGVAGLMALASAWGGQAAPFDADKDPRTLASLDGIVERNDGVPPLLGMAASQSPDAPVPQTPKGGAPERVRFERLQRQAQVQKQRIAELSRTIAALNEQQVQAVASPSPDILVQWHQERDAAKSKVSALRSEIGALKQNVTAAQANEKSKAEQALLLTARLEEAQTAADEQRERLHAQETSREALEKEVAQVRGALTENQHKLMELQREQVGAQKAQADALQQKDVALQEKEQALLAQKKALEDSRVALASATAAPTRVKPEGRTGVRDYAIGTTLAKDMLVLLSEREADGVNVNKTLALAGVQDVFAGDIQLPEAVLTDALSASEKDVMQAQAKHKALAEKTGNAYMTDFAKRKGVKKHPDGFLYRIDFAGNEAIADTDTVTIVVKESLTDGTVINDMDVSGALVSQPLNAYPGLFQSAIRLLKTHGSVTLVVPPALAYGDKGYPPRVPPGATIAYVLRIHDVVKVQAALRP